MNHLTEIFSIDYLATLLTLDTLLKLSLGAVIGLCLGLTGVGGGVLIIPILQVAFGMPTVMAVGTASIISTIVKSNAGLSHVVAGNVDWRALRWMLLGGLPATYLTTQGIVYLYKDASIAAIINSSIDVAIIAVMLLSLTSIILKYRKADTVQEARAHSNPIAVSAGGTCGVILGSTGVGGGVMLLPAFNTLLGVDIKKSIGSSLVMALCLSALTALNYSSGGQSDVATAVLMSIGAFLGVPVALRLIKKFTDKQIYALTIAIIAISFVLIATR